MPLLPDITVSTQLPVQVGMSVVRCLGCVRSASCRANPDGDRIWVVRSCHGVDSAVSAAGGRRHGKSMHLDALRYLGNGSRCHGWSLRPDGCHIVRARPISSPSMVSHPTVMGVSVGRDCMGFWDEEPDHHQSMAGTCYLSILRCNQGRKQTHSHVDKRPRQRSRQHEHAGTRRR